MSIQTLRDNVYKKCVTRLVGYDKIEDAGYSAIHSKIVEVFGIELRGIFNAFLLEMSNKTISENEKKNIIHRYRNGFYSSNFKKIFNDDIQFYYSEDYKKKCIEECKVIDFRTTRSFLFEGNNELGDKSFDFYCVFIGKQGWNSWLEEFNSTAFTISIERNNKDRTITQRYEVVDLPKDLNGIPSLEIENYIPRISLLEDIDSLFSQKNKKINITGISGLGKTLLAKHFIHHYSEQFTHIIWLNCSRGILKAFSQGKGVELLDNMGLATEYKSYAEGKINEEGLLYLVLGRLKKIEGNNLLILDNINEEISYYGDEIHLSSKWKILTTSKEFLDNFYNYAIPYFNEESVQLFYKYYTIERDDDNLIRLLSAIQYHTLTVELLAKTAQQRGLKIIQLVNRFIENGINVVEKAKVIADHNKERKIIIENIEKYLDIIFDTSKLSEEEFNVLLNIAIMQDDAVSIELFVDVYLSGSEDQKEIDKLYGDIDILSKKGWVNKVHNEIFLHNLIKEIFLKKIEDVTQYISSVVYLISCIELYDFTDALKYFSYLENISINIQNTELRKLLAEPISRFYNLLGLHHKSLELYSAYYPLDLNSSNLDNLDYLFFHNLHNYAYRFSRTGNYFDALECYYKIYNIFEGQNPSMDYTFGFFERYCSVERESIKTQKEKELADKISNLVTSLMLYVENIFRIGEVYAIEKNLMKHKEALLFLKDALHQEKRLIIGLETYLKNSDEYGSLSKKTLNRCKSNYAIINVLLGDLYLFSNDYEIAFSSFEDSLNINEQLYGQHSFELLPIYRKLFEFYVVTEDAKKADEYLNKYILICEKLPNRHPKKGHQEIMEAELSNLNNALIIKQKKELENSVNNLFEKALIESKQSKNYTDLSVYYFSRAKVFEKFKLFEKAKLYFKKQLEVEKYSSRLPAKIASIKTNIAGSCLNLEEYEEGIKQIDEVLEIFKDLNTKDNDIIIEKANTMKLSLVKLAFLNGNKEFMIREVKSSLSSVFKIPDYVKQNGSAHEEFFRTLWIDYLLCDFSSVNKKSISISLLPLHRDYETSNQLQISYFNIISSTFAKFEIYDEAIKYLKIAKEFGEKFFPEDLIGSYFSEIALSQLYIFDGEFELAHQFNKLGIDCLTKLLADNPEDSGKQMIKEILNLALENQNKIEKELKKYRK